MRIGMGYDMHRLVPGRKLVLGGIHIPFDKGLAGHSDADALIHAVCDALLGAAGLGDIGHHFPDTDPEYRGIDSIILLKRTWDMIRQRGYAIANVDATVLAQFPRLSPFRGAMEEKIAGALEMDAGRVNVKASTTEGLGTIGSQEGIGSMAIVLLSGGLGSTEV